MLVNKRLSAPDYRTQTLASMMAKSRSSLLRFNSTLHALPCNGGGKSMPWVEDLGFLKGARLSQMRTVRDHSVCSLGVAREIGLTPAGSLV